MADIDISKMNKAEVLAALYNKSQPLGMGILQFEGKDMSKEEAQAMLDDGQEYFDYVKGRIMKIDLSGDNLRTSLYDRDNSNGAAERALAHLL